MSHRAQTSGALAGKTILVTGANGFIGGHLVRRLCTLPDVRVVVLSRGTSAAMPDGVTAVVASMEQLSADTWASAGIGPIDVVLHL